MRMASKKEAIVFVVGMQGLGMLGDMVEAFGFPRSDGSVVNMQARTISLSFNAEDRRLIVDCLLKAESSPDFIRACDDKYNGGSPSAVKQWLGRVRQALMDGFSGINGAQSLN
jgi:hypothetical protein